MNEKGYASALAIIAAAFAKVLREQIERDESRFREALNRTGPRNYICVKEAAAKYNIGERTAYRFASPIAKRNGRNLQIDEELFRAALQKAGKWPPRKNGEK